MRQHVRVRRRARCLQRASARVATVGLSVIAAATAVPLPAGALSLPPLLEAPFRSSQGGCTIHVAYTHLGTPGDDSLHVPAHIQASVTDARGTYTGWGAHIEAPALKLNARADTAGHAELVVPAAQLAGHDSLVVVVRGLAHRMQTVTVHVAPGTVVTITATLCDLPNGPLGMDVVTTNARPGVACHVSLAQSYPRIRRHGADTLLPALIRATITDTAGAPVEQAMVMLAIYRGSSISRPSTYTDSRGAATLVISGEQLRNADSTVVYARRIGYGAQHLGAQIVPGDTVTMSATLCAAISGPLLDVILVPVRPQGRLEGTVRNAAGPLTSLASAQVRLSDGQRAFVDSLGHFHFDSVPPGRITATARAVTYAPDSATVTIQSGRTTRHDFLLHVDSFWVVKREPKWLGCGGAPSGVQCIPPRGLLGEPWGFRAGAWLFQDSAALSRFWLEHAPTNMAAAVRRLSPLDWSHENVVAVSYGSYSGCGPRRYVDRIELRADTTVVVVGEDSLYEGPPRITCAAVVASTDFVIIPRARGAVVVRPANPASGLQPLVVEVVTAPDAGHTPVAVVRADSAEFVFPIVIPTREDSARGYANQSFIWSVDWEVNGIPGFGIEARSGAPRGIAPGRDRLDAVVAAAHLSRAEPTVAGDLPAAMLSPEPALAATVRNGHVVLTLHGRDALRRLWPSGPPDTVTFVWRGPGAQLEGKKVPLVRLP